ncbi:hypothetical protein ACFE04_028184 [Oxalis oulophora]
MAASVFLYHVVGDLTVGKPELVEFYETETVESAIYAIGESSECGIPIWKKKTTVGFENSEMRHQRFVGILNSFDIVAFLAKTHSLEDREQAMNTPVSEVVVPNNSLLKLVDPATRLIDALEMMKQGVRRLLIPKSIGWKGMSRRFSILYNGKWLKNIDTSSNSTSNTLISHPSSSSTTTPSPRRDRFCCLSREDVIRFLIGCLGALAPLPLSSISSLGIINSNYTAIEASCSALDATSKIPGDPCAVAVVEPTSDNQFKIIGDISASRLWKCDYFAAGWALANLSAGQFVMGIDDNTSPRTSPPDLSINSTGGGNGSGNGVGVVRLKKFSSRSIGFFSNPAIGVGRNMYRGRSAPLTCKTSSSLAAVMAQMLSHRATHVWVTLEESDDILVGVVGYADILVAVTKQCPPVTAANRAGETFMNEIQS